MDSEPLLPGRQYLLKSMTRIVPVQVTELKYRSDVDTLEHIAAKVLELNEIGFANLSTADADRLRSLRREPRDRRLHPDRPLLQPDGRGRR